MKIKLIISFLLVILWTGCVSRTSFEEILVSNKSQKSVKPGVDASEQVNQNAVDLSFSVVEMHLTLHEPVILDLKITNNSEETIQLDLGGNRLGGFEYTLKPPNGEEMRLTNPPEPQFTSSGLTKIGPRSSDSQKIVFNQWTDLRVSGNYVLKPRLVTPIMTAAGRVVPAGTIPALEIKVEAVDLKKLERISKKNLDQILSNESLDERILAARAMTYIDDPIAIPYLEQAMLSNRSVEGTVIDSLAQQGRSGSVDRLITIMKNIPNALFSSMAKSSLQLIALKTSDANIKEKIKKSLIGRL